MNAAGQLICLSMIVKNEAAVIRRCLESVRPLIDTWVIVDTGSTDSTQDLIRATMADLPGELFERTWVNFAHNRSEALQLARDRADYTLIIDADDALEISEDFQLPELTADSYAIEIRDVAVQYRRLQLVRNALPWRYEGVLHEFLACEGAQSEALLDGLFMRRNHDGARRRDPLTYRRDALVLEEALAGELSDFFRARYTFYLAQSYWDFGEKKRSLEKYLERAELGFWDQERYISLYRAAQLKADLGYSDREVIDTYVRATKICPFRAEALHGASRHCRYRNLFQDGFDLAMPAADIPIPHDALFLEPWIYEYGVLDELAVNAYWSGHYWECIDAGLKILSGDKIPADHRPRIISNARVALDHLRPAPAESSPPLQSRSASPAEHWVPSEPSGGTEIMLAGLRVRLGAEFDRINLQLNLFDPAALDRRPLVVWFHHDVNQAAVQWCHDAERVKAVARFVFVSNWQLTRYVATFGLPLERCLVLKNATEVDRAFRSWQLGPVWRCAYVSTPFRGLSVLLKAWELLSTNAAELHIWSSMKLYRHDAADETYRALYDRARNLPGVVYHGLTPNAELRAALRETHFLTYPNTWEETSCLSVIEAMAAGCRVIVPHHGALPETTAGYARLYPWLANEDAHAKLFAQVLASELHNPWEGDVSLCTAQQAHCAALQDWKGRGRQWKRLIGSLQDLPRQ